MDIDLVFEKVERDIAFTYIIKKVAETTNKKDRVKIVNDLMIYLEKKQKETINIKIYNHICSCGNLTDDDSNFCNNCKP